MHDTSFFVEILQSLGNLRNDMSRKILAEVGQTDNLMKQLATWAEFKHDVVVLPRFLKFDKLDNVGVVDLTHDLTLLEDIGAL